MSRALVVASAPVPALPDDLWPLPPDFLPSAHCPEERTLLESSWNLLESCSVGGCSLAGVPAGVFLGLEIERYPQLVRQSLLVSGNLAHRLANAIGWFSCAEIVDAGPESHDVALFRALQAVETGECQVAITGDPRSLSLLVDPTLELFRTFPTVPETPSAELLILSAHDEAHLRLRAKDLLEVLRSQSGSKLRMRDVAWSLQLGRASMNVRVAWIVNSREDAISDLTAYLDRRSDPDRIEGSLTGAECPESGFGGDEEDIRYLCALWDAGKLRKLAGFWTSGVSVPWAFLKREGPFQRTPLPAYPFVAGRLQKTEPRQVEHHPSHDHPAPGLESDRISLPSAGETLHGRVLDALARFPTREALRSGARTFSYAELVAASAGIADRLCSLGAGPNERVAIVACKGWEQVAAVLAVHLAGAAYLPVDASLPRERVRELLRIGEVCAAVCQPGTWIPEGIRRIDIEDDRSPNRQRHPLPGSRPARPSDLAYLLFTSGSTGVPKGVMVTHGAICNTVRDLNDKFSFSPEDRVLALSSLSFDLSIYDIYGTLWTGATLVVPPPDAMKEPEKLARLIEQERITILNSVPGYLQLIAREVETFRAARVDSVRSIHCGGDWIPLDLPDRWKALAPGVRFVAIGGNTEASITSCWYDVIRVDPAWKSIPYGKPLANQKLFVLNDRMEDAPILEPGELYIGGVGLAVGYWRDEEKTRSAFVHHPRTGERIYRTGDWARVLDDGNVEFLGRKDDQVKVGGYRIELGEVESQVRACEGVEDAAACVFGEPRGQRWLAVYFTGSSRPEDIRTSLQSRIPAYLIPAILERITAIPLTSNGKVDRLALAARASGRLSASDGPISRSAVTDGELREFSTLLREALRLPPTMGDDVILESTPQELGIDSLLALELRVRLSRSLHRRVPVSALLEPNRTREIAARLLEGEKNEPPAELVPDPEHRFDPFPLTDLQLAYVLGREAHSLGGIGCHVYWEFEREEWDVERLETAWNRIVDRHDMLRAAVLPGGLQQVQREAPRYRIECHEWEHLSPTEVVSKQEELREQIAYRSFDPGQRPLFRVAVSRLPGAMRLHLCFDMLIVDGTSIMLILAELAELYKEPTKGLEPLDLGFRDYVLFCGSPQNEEIRQRSREYWKGRLDALPPALELRLGRDPNALTHPRFRRLEARLGADRWRSLKERFAASGCTSVAGLLAVFTEVLARWTERREFTLNLTVSNRASVHPRISEVVGDFSTTLLVAVDARERQPFSAWSHKVQEQLVRDLEHIAVSGVEVIQELAKRQRTPVLMPIVFTSLLGSTGVLKRKADLASLGHLAYGLTHTPQVWLDAQVLEESDGLYLSWDSVQGLFPPQMLEDIFEVFIGRINRLSEDGSAWDEEWPDLLPLSQRERRREANATALPWPAETLHGRVLQQARQTPERIALVSSGGRFTYGELAGRAAALAQRLVAAGATRNNLVAIVMHKGWEQAVAALAVQMSGACYLPVDASLPSARVVRLLELGGAHIALTQPSIQTPVGVHRLTVSSLDEIPEEPDWKDGPATPDDLAYVLYTSGSTGTPKGVMISHRSVANTVRDVNERFSIGPEDKVLAVSSLSFDLSVWDLFGVLSAGGTVVIPDPESLRDPSQLLSLVQEHRITIWNSVPSFLQLIAETEPPAERLKPLRLLMVSGDWIPVRLPERLPVPMVSLGGATEGSIWSIAYPIGRVDPGWPSIPYGKPLTNQSFHVQNERLEDCPDWVAGELFIGGIGVASGYWGDPERTAAAFSNHPLTGDRLYRTGDWGRYTPDGNIEFLGRRDGQVKISGFRVELGEIEGTLGRIAGVDAAAVVSFSDAAGFRRLAAFIVGTDPTPERVRGELARQLPEYMVPTVLRSVGSLPVTANGKIDRKTLEVWATQGVVESNVASQKPTGDEEDLSIQKIFESPDVLHDSEERRRFVAAHPSIRDDWAEAKRIPLGCERPSWMSTFDGWRSTRQFGASGVTRSSIARLLSCLRGHEDKDLLRFPSPSAGGTACVQIYLHLREGRVDGVEPGVYYYHPVKHELVHVAPESTLSIALHTGTNQTIFQQAAFSLLFVADLNAIRPLYGDFSENFAWMESGHMAQLLRQAAPELGLGLCLIGFMHFSSIRKALAMSKSHVLVGSFLGGAPNAMPVDHRLDQGDPGSNATGRDELCSDRGGSLGHSPSSKMMESIAGIWRDVLRVRDVGLDDNFFEAGGNSVLVVVVQRELGNRLGLRVSIADLFRFPTIRLLAAHLGQKGTVIGSSEAPGPAKPEPSSKPKRTKDHRRRDSRREIRARWQEGTE